MRVGLALVGLGSLTGCGLARPLGQRSTSIPRVGLLGANPELPPWRSFELGLQDLGYVKDETLSLDYRLTGGDLGRLPGLATELVAAKVDVIVASLAPNVEAARRATSTIPIVFVTVNDPVGRGFIASFARPGGNITGQANVTEETSGKRIELLRDIVPHLSHLGVLVNPATGTTGSAEAVAGTLGLQVSIGAVRSVYDLEPALERFVSEGVDGVMSVQDAVFYLERERLARLFLKHRLPAIATHREDAEAGVLLAYGESVADTYRAAASYVDKILKGARPADLPVQRLTKWDLVVNPSTARALGLTIPEPILGQALLVE